MNGTISLTSQNEFETHLAQQGVLAQQVLMKQDTKTKLSFFQNTNSLHYHLFNI